MILEIIQAVYPNAITVTMNDNIIEAFDNEGNSIIVDNNILNQSISDHYMKLEKKKYQKLRAKEYPSFADYLDGVVKGDQEQIQKYIDDCLAIKLKYPKPE